MPDNIVVTLKTEKPAGVWPLVRGCFAWIGFAVVAGVGLSIVAAPYPPQKPSEVIEAFREGWRAYEAYQANDYGKAPDDDPPIIEPLH
jgi:hypothetical protein